MDIKRLLRIGRRFGAGTAKTEHKIVFKSGNSRQTLFCPTKDDARNFAFSAIGQMPDSIEDFDIVHVVPTARNAAVSIWRR